MIPTSELRRSLATGMLLESIVRSTYSERSPGELQPLQWSIMRYLAGCSLAHATVSYIARYLNLTHAPISRSVATLKKKGYLKSVDHPSDSRGSAFSLTQKGLKAIQNDPLLKIASAIDSLPVGLSAQFGRTIELLIYELNATAEQS